MPRPITPFLLSGLFLAVACGDEGTGAPGRVVDCARVYDATCSEVPPEGCELLVRAGDGDQAVVQTVLIESEGTSLCFEGEFSFSEELSITADGTTLRGMGEGATWDFTLQATGGSGANGLRVTGVHGFVMESMTVRNTAGDAVRVEESTEVVFRDVNVSWDGEPDSDNGAYGLYPVGCTNVLIEGSEVVGASDAGIYVGQSHNIIVRTSRAHGNVAGIEIENSMNAEVYENEAFDNTSGLLLFDLPNKPSGNGGTILARDNSVHGNNRANFGSPGTIVSFVPAGAGMIVLAVDDVEVEQNDIRNNSSTGMLLLSFNVLEAVGAGSSANDPDFDPFPETIFIHDNAFMDNGTSPQGLLLAALQPGEDSLEDIVWDGIVDETKDHSDGSLDLCIQNNGAATFRNFQVTLPGLNFGDPTFDLTPHDCAHDPVVPVAPML